MITFAGEGWSVEFPDTWIGVRHKAHVEILWEDNGSALRVFTVHQEAAVSHADFAAFVANYVTVPGPPRVVDCGEFSGLLFRQISDDKFFRQWALHCRRTLLAVVHSCPLEVAGVYDAEVDGVLASLRGDDPAGGA